MPHIARLERRSSNAASRRLTRAVLPFLLATILSGGATFGFGTQNAGPGADLSAPLTASLPGAGSAESCDATSGAYPSPPIPPADRNISWKLMAPNIARDQKQIWLFPVRVAQGRHWKPALGFVAGTAALIALDPHDEPYFRNTRSFTGFNNVLSGRGTSVGLTAMPLGFYAVALARHRQYDQHTALLVGEAIIDAELLTTVMKDVDGRLRPRDVPASADFSDTFFRNEGSLLSGHGSFPSGHTIAAFSIATVFTKRYAQHRWVPWVAYSLAGAVGFSRITLRAHFTSDVFAGAVLGYSISNYAVLRR